MNLNQANELVLRLLAESDGPITFGLLPVDEDDQEQIISLVTDEARGDVGRLTRMLRFRYVAAVAYGVSAAASQAVTQGGTFWGPFSQRMGMSFENPTHRNEFSRTFGKVCQHIDVVDPDVSEMGWTLVAPVMAQASILHCWAELLARGMRTTLRHRPLPDLEDRVALASFADDLSTHIHNQPNLRNVLRTEVGGVVAQRLIKSCVFGHFELLPHHLRGPMREAFEGEGRQSALKSPYVSFSVVDGGFVLILPKQPPRLISERSYWEIEGHQYSARADSSLSEHELGARELEVKIRNLRQGYGDQSFRVSLSLSADQPFRVFEAKTCRERSIKFGEENTLPPNEYFVVMRPDAQSDEEDAEDILTNYRLLEGLELRPGVQPLGIEADGRRTLLSPSLKAGLFHAAGTEGAVSLADGLLLHYGDAFRFLAYFPNSQHTGQVRLEISCAGSQLLTDELPLSQEADGIYDYSDGVEAHLQQAGAGLEPGIHLLKVELSTGTVTVSRSLWYWRGLESISKYLGFRCTSPPQNLDYTTSRGITPGKSGCDLDPGYHSPRIVLGLKGGARLTLLRPGIRVACIDPREGDEWEMRGGEAISIADTDSRVLVFESGGFEPWSIECNGCVLAKLDRKKTEFRVGLRSLLAQHGKVGLIAAKGLSEEPINLVRFASRLVAQPLVLETDHGRGIYCWKTSIPTTDLGRLGFRISDYSLQPIPIVGQVLTAYTEGESRELPRGVLEICPGVTASTTLLCSEANLPERLELSLEVEFEKTDPRLLLIDVLRASAETEDWLPLLCEDGPNTSRLTITSIGRVSDALASADWWPHLWRIGSHLDQSSKSDLYQHLSETEICSALREISALNSIKYPKSVYFDSAKNLSSLAHRLSNRRNENRLRDTDAWWSEGVIELKKHAHETVTPVVRPFLFTNNPYCLKRRWKQVLSPEAAEDDWLVSALRLSRDVIEAGGRVPYAELHFHSNRHSPELFGSFANFDQVASGQSADFRGFDFKKFFVPIFERAESHDESATPLDGGPVLSARHLLHAVVSLNRRARILDKASAADADHPLQGALNGLSVALRETENLMTSIHQKIGFVPWAGKSEILQFEHADTPVAPPLPLLASKQAEHLHQLTWRFCVIARGAAQGHIPKQQFATIYERFGEYKVQTHPLNLMLSFAPELFAYYCGLLDFALLAPTSSEL